jgi:hypothetical protein
MTGRRKSEHTKKLETRDEFMKKQVIVKIPMSEKIPPLNVILLLSTLMEIDPEISKEVVKKYFGRTWIEKVVIDMETFDFPLIPLLEKRRKESKC